MSLFEHNQTFSNIRLSKCHPSNRRKSRSIRLSSSTKLNRPNQARANHFRRNLRPQPVIHRVNVQQVKTHLPKWPHKMQISLVLVKLIRLICQAVLIKRDKTTKNKVTSKVAKIKELTDRVAEVDMVEVVTTEEVVNRGSREDNKASITIIKWTKHKLSLHLSKLLLEVVWHLRWWTIHTLKLCLICLICKTWIPQKSEKCCNLFAVNWILSCSKQLFLTLD